MKRFALIVAICLAATGIAVARQETGGVKVAAATQVTGTVESNALNSMTLRDDSGRLLTVQFDTGTVGALGHPVGTHVRIDYHRDDQGQAIADEIQGVESRAELEASASAGAPQDKVISEPVPPSGAPIAEPQVAATEPAPAVASAAVPASEPIVEAKAEPENRELPRTASHLYLFGLLGFAALSSATILRVAR